MIKKISFIGAGSMAEAVIAGIVNTQFVNSNQVFVSNKQNQDRLNELVQAYDIVATTNKEDVIQDADIIVLATKPNDLESALLESKQYIKENQLIVSVIAGISTSFISSIIGKNNPVIRTMPNTSASIGLSATALAKGQYATDAHVKLVEELFNAIGKVAVVKEDQMHIVTGISGSGPAYVYYLVEAMQKAAIEEGLDEETAMQLITQTIIGAGNMLEQSHLSAARLRENVTSPNGTTAAGLDTLKKYNFEEAVIQCVKNASQRSKQLGENK